MWYVSVYSFISLFKNAGCDSLKSHEAQFEKPLVNNEKIIEQMHKMYAYYIIKTLKIKRIQKFLVKNRRLNYNSILCNHLKII